MKKILFATGNPTKARRFSKELLKNGIEVITPNDIDIKVNVLENGHNAIENALLKARAYSEVIDIPVMGMDDNLYIEGVPEDKQPGMFVRRVNGRVLTDEEMLEHYIGLVKQYGADGRLTCRWVYGLAVVFDGKEKTYSWSKEDFYLVSEPSSKFDSGYPLNSISVNKKLNKYFVDMTEEDKKRVGEDELDVVDFIVKSVGGESIEKK